VRWRTVGKVVIPDAFRLTNTPADEGVSTVATPSKPAPDRRTHGTRHEAADPPTPPTHSWRLWPAGGAQDVGARAAGFRSRRGLRRASP